MKLKGSLLATALLAFRLGDAQAFAAQEAPDASFVYKNVGGKELLLHAFNPPEAGKGKPSPAVLVIHGGGWSGGAPASYFGICRSFAGMGLRAFGLQYRLFKKDASTVFECVKDARSAMRYLKVHAKELGVDPGRIVACGGSAGGHLAAATALFDDVDEAGDDVSISASPFALILFNPVLDTSEEGYGSKRLGDSWRQLSPLLRVKPGAPPSIIFHAVDDKTTPFEGSFKFKSATEAAGSLCELVSYPGGGHSFYDKSKADYEDVMRRAEEFLKGRGALP